MIDLNTVAPAGSTAPPSTRAEARGRIALIDDAITAIRTQIAAADMKRQAKRGALDPDWYHRAKTASPASDPRHRTALQPRSRSGIRR
jgi:hypothetical protein